MITSLLCILSNRLITNHYSFFTWHTYTHISYEKQNSLRGEAVRKKIHSRIKDNHHPERQAVSVSITMFCFPTQQTFWKSCLRLLSPLLRYPSTPSSITCSSIISQNLHCQSHQWDHWPCKHSQGTPVCLNSLWHRGPRSLSPLHCGHSHRLFCSVHRHSSCYGSFP